MAHADALSRNAIEDNRLKEAGAIFHIKVADWVASSQLTDEKIKMINDILSKEPETDYDKQIHREFKLHDERIYRKTATGRQWVVPKRMRRQVVQICHDEMGHFAAEKTLNKLNENYWFPNMREYVQKYISSCIPCLTYKRAGGKKPGYLHPIKKVAVPFHTIHMDHLGPFPKSIHGKSHIIVAVDAFTKFVQAKAVRNTEAAPTIAFLQEIITVFGVPSRLITDRGTSYTSRDFKNFCEEHGVTHILTAVSTPRANGQVERYNRTLLSSLASTTVEENKWDDVLSRIQFAINNTVNKGTGKTPSQLLFGYAPRSTKEKALVIEIGENINEINVKQNRREATASISAEQTASKTRYDSKRSEATKFNIEDIVLIEKQIPASGGSRKLAPIFDGPMRIIKVLPNDRYVVRDTRKGFRKKNYEAVYAVDKIRLYKPQSDSDISD